MISAVFAIASIAVGLYVIRRGPGQREYAALALSGWLLLVSVGLALR